MTRRRSTGLVSFFFDLKDAPSLLASLNVKGTWWLHRKIQAKTAFMSFAWGAVRQEYLRDVNPLYDTEYENLVLSGQVSQHGKLERFFLVSGVHDKDFPWGDGEIFWDVLLVVGQGANDYRRYCITDRVLEGLELNVKEGTYRYKGPIFELTDGTKASFRICAKGSDRLWNAKPNSKSPLTQQPTRRPRFLSLSQTTWLPSLPPG